MCVLSCSVSECLLQRGLVCSSVVKEKPPDAGTRECADCLLFSSEPDSESSEPTKPTNEPPRNKATTPGLVGESAVAASSDRTAPGEVFSQGLRQRQPNPLDLETSLKSEECTKTSPAVSSVDQGPTEPNHERPAVLLPCKLPPTDQGAPHKQVFGVSVAVQSTTRSPGSTPPDETLVAVLASDQGKGLERASSACTTPLVSAEESLLLPDSEDEGSLDTQAMPDAGLQADGPPITSGTASRRCPQKRDRSWYPTLSSRLSTSLCVGS
eukprot:m.257387 g.257387  ORF g.257387 m.257387 type:complete len:268 (+) comp54567_c0_seq5:623-1426(+)